MKTHLTFFGVIFLIGLLCLSTGCDRLLRPGVKNSEEAQQAEKSKDYPKAVRLYEASLDGTSSTSESHYHLGVIYDDCLHDRVSALHHYRRYLSFHPTGSKSEEVKRSVKRLEAMLVTDLGEGMPISRSEAIRLKNENMALRQELAEHKAAEKSAATAANTKNVPTAAKASKPDKKPGKDSKTYVVQNGDTLAAISRKFYKTSARWKDIADANHNQLGGKVNLKAGMTLIIP
ncbi:MAG: LysM domain-containing protein [Chthoniobacterales bacterium]